MGDHFIVIKFWKDDGFKVYVIREDKGTLRCYTSRGDVSLETLQSLGKESLCIIVVVPPVLRRTCIKHCVLQLLIVCADKSVTGNKSFCFVL